jgi:transposase-like protein
MELMAHRHALRRRRSKAERRAIVKATLSGTRSVAEVVNDHLKLTPF